MALLVGYGYAEERVLGLTLPCFDALVRAVLRVRREELAESARTMAIATHCGGEELEKWLAGLLGTTQGAKNRKKPIASGDDVMQSLNGKPRRRGQRGS